MLDNPNRVEGELVMETEYANIVVGKGLSFIDEVATDAEAAITADLNA